MSERVGRKRKANATAAVASTSIFDHLHSPTIVKEMLSQGADANGTDADGCSALFLAASLGHTKTMGHLINHGAQVSSTSSPDECTALYGASLNGQIESVRTLLRNGALVDVPCQDGSTAVRYYPTFIILTHFYLLHSSFHLFIYLIQYFFNFLQPTTTASRSHSIWQYEYCSTIADIRCQSQQGRCPK